MYTLVSTCAHAHTHEHGPLATHACGQQVLDDDMDSMDEGDEDDDFHQHHQHHHHDPHGVVVNVEGVEHGMDDEVGVASWLSRGRHNGGM